MKLNRKWILVMSLVLSVAIATGGTLAYMTATTITLTNTFTLGDVSISLTEDFVQDSPMYPGTPVPKEPTITNTGKTPAWVWMKVKMPADVYPYIKLHMTEPVDAWDVVEDKANGVMTILYNSKLAPNGTATPFDEVVLAADANLDNINKFNMDITAYAIQDKPFTSVAQAYEAFDGENGDEGTATEVTNDETLAAALAAGAKNISLKSGNYGVIDVTDVNQAVTLFANDDQSVTIAGINGQSNNLSADITIKGVTIDNSKQTSGWYTGTSKNIKPCVGVWGGNYTFENCVFFVTGESGAETGVMSWWTTNHGVMNFKNCTFNGGKTSARAMQIYGNYNLNVTGCTFNTAKDYSIKFVGDKDCVATFKNNNVTATINFVQTGSPAYPGEDYILVFTGNTLADGIKHVYVENAEDQIIRINGVNKAATDEAIY